MFRTRQILLVVCTLLASWLLMQVVHEFGHMTGAWLSGGRVDRIVLHPLAISRTDIDPNPHPLVVVWAGPVIGAIFPIVIWAIAAKLKSPERFLLRFFAGFCLIANGEYIAIGSFGRVGDCGTMLCYGSPIWLLWLFGAATVPIGLWLWNGLGAEFGFGGTAKNVSNRQTIVAAGALVVITTLELLLSSR